MEIYQVETTNPHFHEDKGDEHVAGMRYAALQGIHGSPLCTPRLREEILEYLERAGIEDPDALLAGGPVTYPLLDTLDWGAFGTVLRDQGESYEELSPPRTEMPPFLTPPLPWREPTGHRFRCEGPFGPGGHRPSARAW